MLDFLREERISESLLRDLTRFRDTHHVETTVTKRIPNPVYRFFGRDAWEEAIVSLLSGENILLTGPKATGKNVFADCLAAAFGRPSWDISLYVNTDAATLIGADTLENGSVSFRPGPIYQCARYGGFGTLDEINMAKNESLAVLHATLDYRREIDIPGYDRILLNPATRFIATMNYGYAGTRELNEALTSRFMVLDIPVITDDRLLRLITREFPALTNKYASQFVALFQDLKRKCESGEISTRALDLRGLLAAIKLTHNGLTATRSLELALVNKAFTEFERVTIRDVIRTRFPRDIDRDVLFKGAQ